MKFIKTLLFLGTLSVFGADLGKFAIKLPSEMQYNLRSEKSNPKIEIISQNGDKVYRFDLRDATLPSQTRPLSVGTYSAILIEKKGMQTVFKDQISFIVSKDKTSVLSLGLIFNHGPYSDVTFENNTIEPRKVYYRWLKSSTDPAFNEFVDRNQKLIRTSMKSSQSSFGLESYLSFDDLTSCLNVLSNYSLPLPDSIRSLKVNNIETNIDLNKNEISLGRALIEVPNGAFASITKISTGEKVFLTTFCNSDILDNLESDFGRSLDLYLPPGEYLVIVAGIHKTFKIEQNKNTHVFIN